MNKMEIVLGPYSLKQMKKRAAASPLLPPLPAKLLGLRPIISLIDGKTVVEAKVRGDDKC